MEPSSAVTAGLVLSKGPQGQIGAQRVALLQAIGTHGSIAGAARAAGLSYKGAWDAVQALNNLFDGPMIEAQPGGRAGGAAVVTPKGKAAVAAFRRVQAEVDAAMAKLENTLAGEPARDLFWSLGMRTSARNALRGAIARVTPGEVNSEVTLKLADGVEITAILTKRSIEDLELAPGKPAIALIKSSFVILAKGENLKTSARNQIPGVVSGRTDGAVNCEAGVDIGGGKTLTATITLESANALELTVGDKVTALVKAPHVILAVE